MLLEAGFIAAQSAFDLVQRVLETRVGLLGFAFRLKIHARTQMQGTIRAIAGPFARYHDMAADAAVEITRDDRLDLVEHVAAKGFSNVEVLAGYS